MQTPSPKIKYQPKKSVDVTDFKTPNNRRKSSAVSDSQKVMYVKKGTPLGANATQAEKDKVNY